MGAVANSSLFQRFRLLVCYLVNFFFMPPSPAEFFHGFLFKCSDYAVLQLVGTVGAVIMPHNLYLHSGICKQRLRLRKSGSGSRAIRALFVVSGLCSSLVMSRARRLRCQYCLPSAGTADRKDVEHVRQANKYTAASRPTYARQCSAGQVS